MLSRVTLLVALIAVVLGDVVTKPLQPQDGGRGGKGWGLQNFFDKVYFNKTKIPDEVVDDYEGGNVTITGDSGEFFNPTSTEAVAKQEIILQYAFTATVPITADVVQIKVHIRDLNVMGPVEGDCGNDSLVITGTNPGPEIPVLCGVVSDQILYLDVDNVDGPVVFTMLLNLNNSIDQTWNISITKLKDADSVQRRCLQYLTATSGTIGSFNYGGDSPMMLNDQTYSICFGYVVGYCSIAFNFARLDLGRLDKPCGSDYLLIGDDQNCGEFEDITIIANATGPINVGVRSGAVNEIEEEGFSAKYLMIGC